jgi:bifunctional NMN adenylyltransferase/nudix hydrolase
MNLNPLSVVVGRFQVPNLHRGHRHLLDQAERAGQLLVVLGSSGGLPDVRNPLPYEVRELMVKQAYPTCLTAELFDEPVDANWSLALDALIKRFSSKRPVTLFASRDSFADVYSGEYPVMLLPALEGYSGSAMRDVLWHQSSEDFRAGLISAQKFRHPISYQAVDIGLIRHETGEVLLGHKPADGSKLRLIGGFVDPSDQTLEATARRELEEETGITLTHGFQYLGSQRIEDHRYRGSVDGVMTALFATYLMGGIPRASDDIDDLRWVKLLSAGDLVVDNHRPLVERLVRFANVE